MPSQVLDWIGFMCDAALDNLIGGMEWSRWFPWTDSLTCCHVMPRCIIYVIFRCVFGKTLPIFDRQFIFLPKRENFVFPAVIQLFAITGSLALPNARTHRLDLFINALLRCYFRQSTFGRQSWISMKCNLPTKCSTFFGWVIFARQDV